MLDSVQIQRAIDLWDALTAKAKGVFGVWTEDREIEEAFKLDPSGLTSILILECFLRGYLKQKTFTVFEIMTDYAKIDTYLKDAHELFSIVQAEPVQAFCAEFRAALGQELARHGVAGEKVEALLNDADTIAFLRRDAIRSLASLEVHQFLDGEPAADTPLKAVDRVYQAFNIDAMLAALRDMPQSGVALTLVRDPADSWKSFFCFAVRNGGRIFVFTDRQKFAHPKGGDMVRRPDRAFDARAWRNHFPYEIVPHHYNEEGDVVFDAETTLVAGDLNLVPLMPLSALDPVDAVWIVMMFSLIADRVRRQDWRAPALSYTAGMIQEKAKLVTARDGAQLPAAIGYQPITLDRLSVAEVVSEDGRAATGAESVTDPVKPGAHQSFRRTARVNQHLEDRYGHVVTEDLVNLTGVEGGVLKLAGVSHGPFSNEKTYKLTAFSPFSFGTEDELRKDRAWIARYNAAMAIQRAADEEFKERRKQVEADVKALVRDMQPHILKEVVRLEALARVDKNAARREHWFSFGDIKDRDTFWHNEMPNGIVLGAWDHFRHPNRRCAITDGPAAWRARFAPKTAEEFVSVVGCAIDDLPDVLRHWRFEKPYVGNTILDRVDPVDGHVHDPWIDVRLTIDVFLSKSAWSRLSKQT